MPYSRWFYLSCLKSVIHKALLDQYEFKVKPLNKVRVNISVVSLVKAVYYYYYTNLTFVRESRRSREAIRPELKRFPTLHRWTWTLHDMRQPTDTARSDTSCKLK